MPIWNVLDVTAQPVIRLSRWCVFRHTLESTGQYSEYLAGWNLDDHEGRVSTSIVALDPAAAVVRTHSGRSYQLIGEPGHDPDAMYVFYRRFGGTIPEGARREDMSMAYWIKIQNAHD
jgi:hypothetical protein